MKTSVALVFCFKKWAAYEVRSRHRSSDVCCSDLRTTPSDGKVLGLRMMQHDRRGRLHRVELVRDGQHDADLRRLEQAQELLLVLQRRAGRVAEGVARAAIALEIGRAHV